ncbi:hypothetical protein THMIRHAS_21750 [Thiosulfatimonas sediminis]|uniref:Uncharacterized protein n=1 Tax=Thiosulfatimonas sediminis TaxID=2675054 RepID=A0A6F8PXC0_9GAMM|nr:hypothetical protein [Thiosulfatimonas sediminis]BBP46802.1 hypothetical protein THMIRHAS_21750 [Thiosulfatimonas sediminis]
MLTSLLGLDTPTADEFHSDDLIAATVSQLKDLPVLGASIGPLISTLHGLPLVGEDIKFVTSTLHATLPGGSLVTDLLDTVTSLPVVSDVLGLVETLDNGLLGGITGEGGLLPSLLAPTGLVGGLVGTVLGIADGLPIVGDLLSGGSNSGLLGGVLGDSGLLGGLLGGNGLLGGVLGSDGLLGGLLGETGVVGSVLNTLIGEQGVVTGLVGTVTGLLDGLPIVGDLLGGNESGGLLGGLLGGSDNGGLLGGLLGDNGLLGGLLGGGESGGILDLNGLLGGENGLLDGLLGGLNAEATTNTSVSATPASAGILNILSLGEDNSLLSGIL